MYNRGMKQRIIPAVIFACCAFVALLVRYGPPRAALYELGDPLDARLVAGFADPESDGPLTIRRTIGDAALLLPLADDRGARSVVLQLRGVDPVSLRLGAGAATVITPLAATWRSYALFVPPQTGRRLDITLAAPHPVLLDQVSVIGREGAPSFRDLLALLLLATIPVSVSVLTIRLPLDWSLAATGLVTLALVLLPSADLPTLVQFGPLAACLLALLALLPWCRTRPTLTLLLYGGALLRLYALGWGSGYVFHPDEQALVAGVNAGIVAQLSRVSAWLLARVTNDATWRSAWRTILIGRMWSAAAGTATIGAVYALGRLALRRRWALLATAYVATTPLLIQQSHVATSANVDALLILLLLLGCTWGAIQPSWRVLSSAVALAVVAALSVPGAVVMTALPAIGLLSARRVPPLPLRRTPLLIGSLAVLVFWLVSLTVSASTASSLSLRAALDPTALWQQLDLPAYVYPLVNMLLWGMGPLLLQLGVFGWGVGLILAARNAASRLLLPLLIGMGAYFAVVGRGPVYSLRAMTVLTPLLCLTAALLLQTFAQRLPFRTGQRTVRLLAGTALALTVAATIGLINVYRVPDARVAASRRLIADVPPGTQVLLDATADPRLPLGNAPNFTRTILPITADVSTRLAQYAEQIVKSDYVVTGVDRTDVDLIRIARADPLAACYYRALFDGRLGFIRRAAFAAQPHIGRWTIDDRRADGALRLYDHPNVYLYERISRPTPAAVALLLQCDLP